MVKTAFYFHFVLFSPLFLTHKFAQRLQLFIVMSVRWFSKEHGLVFSRTIQLHLIKSVLFGFSKSAPQPHPNPHVGDWISRVTTESGEIIHASHFYGDAELQSHLLADTDKPGISVVDSRGPCRCELTLVLNQIQLKAL